MQNLLEVQQEVPQEVPEMASRRNESSNQATYGACASTTQHSAGVSPLVSNLIGVQQEAPSTRNGIVLLQQTVVESTGSGIAHYEQVAIPELDPKSDFSVLQMGCTTMLPNR